jgi:hypothetical protein
MDVWGGIGRVMRGFFSGILRSVSNTCEGSKILTFLFRPEWCAAHPYISDAGGR